MHEALGFIRTGSLRDVFGDCGVTVKLGIAKTCELQEVKQGCFREVTGFGAKI